MPLDCGVCGSASEGGLSSWSEGLVVSAVEVVAMSSLTKMLAVYSSMVGREASSGLETVVSGRYNGVLVVLEKSRL